MRRITLYLIICLISIFCSPITKAQGYSPTSWDEVANDIAQGREDAVLFLLDLKSEAENTPSWDDNSRRNYLMAISLLQEFTGRKGFLKDQETFLRDAIRQFNKRDSVANNPYTRCLWVMMTRLQKDLGDAGALLNYGHEALKMYEEAQDYSYDYVVLLHNIAFGYVLNRDWLSAKLYLDEAIELSDAMLAEGSIPKEWSNCDFRNTRGLIETELGQYDKAVSDFTIVIRHSDPNYLASAYWLALNNLSVAYTKQGQYRKAREVLNRTKSESLELSLFKNQNLGVLDYLTNEPDSASTHLKNYNRDVAIQSMNVVQAFSETESESYLKKSGQEIVFFNNLLGYRFPMLTEECFDANLYSRDVSMAVHRALHFGDHSQSEDSTYSHLNAMRDEAIRKGLSRETRDSLHREIIDLQKILLRNNPEITNAILSNIGFWKRVRDNLNENEASVMFCYVPELSDANTATGYFGAFITMPEDTVPRLVKLGNVDDVEDLFYNLNPSTEFISQLYSDETAKRLYEMLWAPLQPYLGSADRIYYSTCGTLGMINHEALVNNEGTRIGFEKEMIYLSSPTLINQFNIYGDEIDVDIAALFGDPSFNLNIDDMERLSAQFLVYSGNESEDFTALRGELMRDGWSQLPGTKKEIQNIVDILNTNGIISHSYIGESATEESVKALSGQSPSILHFATHGFVILNQSQYDASAFAQSMTGLNERSAYMLRSGLVLSGGNNAWMGVDIPEGVEDGILTAEEISRLDLSNTKLVVLSACDTGRGHVDPVEGVWGLQRAFKQAGVESILMTLWKIPDQTTALFMEKFYEQLLAGRGLRQSVKDAQRYLIKNGATDPFYWAAFVALD